MRRKNRPVKWRRIVKLRRTNVSDGSERSRKTRAIKPTYKLIVSPSLVFIAAITHVIISLARSGTFSVRTFADFRHRARAG